MPYPPQVFSLDGHAYGLTVSGVQVITKVPTDIAPLRWEMPSEMTNGDISFTVMDQGETSLPVGSVVRLTDNVENDLLASGVLINRRIRRGTGPNRLVECEAVGWGWYLDNRYVSQYVWPLDSTTPYGTELRIAEIVNTWGGPVRATTFPAGGMQTNEAGTVTATPLRSAISSYEAASYNASSIDFHSYVDSEAQYKYWWGSSSLSALGTASLTVGSLGDYVPERLSYELGADGAILLVGAYGTAGNFLGWRMAGQGTVVSATSWEAGDPSKVYTSDIIDPPVDVNVVTKARMDAYYLNGEVASLSFDTTEHGGWQPHQYVVVDDEFIGLGRQYVILSVSGSIDHRNAIEWQVTAGAMSRSIVQTVVGK